MAQVAVLCVDLDETIEGEEMGKTGEQWTGDNQDLLLPRIQRLLIESVLAFHKPTVIVNITSSAIDLGTGNDKANAVIQAFYPGA
jgi:beta-glucosidase